MLNHKVSTDLNFENFFFSPTCKTRKQAQYHDCGSTNGAVFSQRPGSGPDTGFLIKFSGGEGGRTSDIEFICDPNQGILCVPFSLIPNHLIFCFQVWAICKPNNLLNNTNMNSTSNGQHPLLVPNPPQLVRVLLEGFHIPSNPSQLPPAVHCRV